MLTIFACPKSFSDPRTSLIQTNAITSWTLLNPTVQVLLAGSEPGMSELCSSLRIDQVEEVATSDSGAPRMDTVFSQCRLKAIHEVVCYVNSDVILMGDFVEAVRRVAHHERFLMSGSRTDLAVEEAIDFAESGWEEKLRSETGMRGEFSYWGNDYFVFNRSLFANIPPLVLGRGHFDGWLFWEAERQRARIIDATKVVSAIHQSHDYGHIVDGSDPWDSREGVANLELIGERRYWYIASATHDLTPNRERRVIGRKLHQRLVDSRPGRWLLYDLGPLRHRLGVRKKTLLSMRSAFRRSARRP